MALKVSVPRVLKDALGYPSGESFEESLGRSVRRHGGTYQDYVDLIARIREAARWLADQP